MQTKATDELSFGLGLFNLFAVPFNCSTQFTARELYQRRVNDAEDVAPISVMRRVSLHVDAVSISPDYHCNCEISLDDLRALASAVTRRLLCHQLLRFTFNRHVVTGSRGNSFY